VFGAFFAHHFTDTYGRRSTFILAAVGFIVGVVLQSFSSTFDLLMLGRSFVGLGVGTGLAVDPLYIAEVTPPHHRGELVTWSEIANNMGLVLGFSTGFFLAWLPDGQEWRLMILLGAILPTVMIALVIFIIPESPRWLVSRNRVDEATEILLQTYPPGSDVDLVVEEIKQAIIRERVAENSVGWMVLLHPTPAIQRMLLVGIGTAVSQQIVGIDAIQYYLLDVIDESGIESRQAQSAVLVILGIVKLSFVILGGKLFDTKGRRPLLFISLIGMAVSLALVSLAFWIDTAWSQGVIICGLGLYLAFFSVGVGPGAWLIPSEVFANCIRGKAMSVAAFWNRLGATIMASTFLSIANGVGWAGFFLLLSGASLLVLFFLYTYLPETKGRSLEDMSVYFAEITKDGFILEAEAALYKDDGDELELASSSLQHTLPPSSLAHRPFSEANANLHSEKDQLL
jgi:sugar porter (SP) family MFS transporter